MQIFSKMTGVALIAVALLITCSRNSIVDTDDSDAVADKIAVVAADVSECGGFTGAAARSAIAGEVQGEILEWAYVAGTRTLDLIHSGLALNCCGVHTVDATYADGIVTIRENDQPEPDGGRCRCMCDFDFRVAITGVPAGVTGIRIELTIDDSTAEHWTGIIDPADGAGKIVISAQAE